MTQFQPFELERMMSKWENVVEYNLSESGVHPLTLGELLDLSGRDVESLRRTELNYPQTDGTAELKQSIAALYPGASPNNVLVTVGAAEANFLAVQTLLAPGDEIAILLPNYLQIWGISLNQQLNVRTFGLLEEQGWALDLESLNRAVTERTKVVAVVNPNNPTGHIFSRAEMDAIIAAAERRGAYLIADEVYAGAEQLTDEQTPSFYGRYDRVLAQGSLSKAYGLPGLRIGWTVGPPDVIDAMWARHEYAAIATTALSNELAAMALRPDVRLQIIDRTRHYIRRGFPVLKEWMDAHPGMFELVRPEAAAIAFLRYNLDINSSKLIERLIREKSVLIAPGDHFGLDHFIRISFGLPAEYLRPALDRIHDLIFEIANGD